MLPLRLVVPCLLSVPFHPGKKISKKILMQEKTPVHRGLNIMVSPQKAEAFVSFNVRDLLSVD